MFFVHRSTPRHRDRLGAFSTSALLLAGCANPGPPRAPSLHLPAQVSALKTERVGSNVLLTWTTPDKTADDLPLRGPVTAAICREVPPAASASSCQIVGRTAVVPGESHFSDPLPPFLLADPPRLLAYRIELFNSRGRSANPSPPAYAAAGAAPDPPAALRVLPSRRGALVEWNLSPPPPPSQTSPPSASPSQNTPAEVELTRTLIAAAPSAAPPQPPRQPHSAAVPGAKSAKPENAFAPVLLRPRPETSTAVGAQPGLLDPGVVLQSTYAYTAQRIRTVSLGGHTLELRSDPSASVTFIDRYIFPPGAPQALQAVSVELPDTAPSIDLSWDPNPEADLLGYNVYRADTPAGPWQRLNPEPLPGPAFRDLTAQPGHTFFYRVTALDRSRNESPPGPAVRETLAQTRP